MTDWDPIGIQDAPEAGDEYDQYVDSIAKMVISKKPVSELSRRLLEIEVESMGLPGNQDRAWLVAQKLWSLDSSI